MKRRHVNSGAPAELMTAKKIVELGYIVSFPFFAKASYDLIADTGKKLIRVQIKTIYKGKTDNGKVWMMDFTKPKGMSFKYEKYTEEDCDYIVGACPEKNKCFVFPILEVKHRRQATFILDDDGVHHMQHKSKEWANSFLEKWF